MDDLNYHHLRHFHAVAREGSVAAAARALYVTPQTVSAQVRALEKAFGLDLFDRSSGRMVLTHTGRLVAEHADRIFERGRDLLELVRHGGERAPTRVVIGVADVMPKLVVRRLLEPIYELETAFRLVCVEDRPERLLTRLAAHDLDVVLSDAPAPGHLRVRSYDHVLGESGVSVVAADALAAGLSPGFPGSLDDAPLLLPSVGTALRGLLDKWFDAHGVRPRVAAEFDDSALAKELAALGVGALAVPSVIAEEVAARHGLVVLGSLGGLRERFYAISVERRLQHPAVVALAYQARHEFFGGNAITRDAL